MTILDPNTVVVYNDADLRNAITGTNIYTYIYFGDNITLTAGISIPLSKSGLIIDGTYKEVTYTYTDMNSATMTETLYFTNYNATTPTMNITMQNMKLNLRNYYGVIMVGDSAYARNTTVTLNNISSTGSQLIYNNFGNTVINDSTIEVGSGTRAGEIGEVHKVRIGGNTTITHTSTGYNGFFLRGGTGQGITIATGANVTITTAQNLVYCEGRGDLIVEPGAKLNVTAPTGITFSNGNGLQNVLVDTNASLILNRTGTTGESSLAFSSSLTINQGATFIIGTNFTNANYQIYSTVTNAKININDPRQVLIYGSSSRVFGFTGTANLNLNGRQINQWNALGAGDIYDLPTYPWHKFDDGILTFQGTTTTTATSITSTNLTADELLELPAPTSLGLGTLRMFSMGYLPNLYADPITEESTKITGKTTQGNGIKVTTKVENLYGAGDGNGSFSVTLSSTLKEGDKVWIIASENNYLYHYKKVTVVYPGELKLYFVPDQIPFDLTATVATTPVALFGRIPSDWKLQVYDSRIYSSDWTLYASIEEPLTSENSHTLPGSLIYVNESNVVTHLNTNDTLVYTGKDNGGVTKITDVTWDLTKGVLFTPNGNRLHEGETYITDITWSLKA